VTVYCIRTGLRNHYDSNMITSVTGK